MKNLENYKWTYEFSLAPTEKFIKETHLGGGITKVFYRENYGTSDKILKLVCSRYYLNGEIINLYKVNEILNSIKAAPLVSKPLVHSVTSTQALITFTQEHTLTALKEKENIIGGNNNELINIADIANYNLKILMHFSYDLIWDFKFIDSGVYLIKTTMNPNLKNLEHFIFSIEDLYLMSYGVNNYSLGLTAATGLYKYHQSGYIDAAKQISASISHMLLPHFKEYDFPSLQALTFNIIMATHAGYNSIRNYYSIWAESPTQINPADQLNCYNDIFLKDDISLSGQNEITNNLNN